VRLLGENEVLFVGDSTNDILAARRAGISIAVVKGGEGFGEGADFILPSLRKLPQLLEREKLGKSWQSRR
jgi:phosphoglycolate phosphatase-like HAD superfamily hydrolase